MLYCFDDPLPHLDACHKDAGSAASAARQAFFQPKDLVWLEPRDEHSDEEIEQAAAGIRLSTRLGAG
ncbi:hypothetical protein SMB554_27650 (plasmid) [Sinorhizobium meliloti]|nr:hypothetical protein SMB554_27650 [Sinorhizobium meliloti]